MQQKFIELFKEALEIDGRAIELSDAFRDYDEWSSLGQLSLIAMLDEQFDVVIETAEFEKLQTVSDLLTEVSRKMTN
jgi:acyl carrier protein